MAAPSRWDLDFASSRKAAQKHMGQRLEILRPMIRFGHEFLPACRDVCSDDVDVAVAMCFRQLLEFADSVDILLRHLVIAPAAAQARSAVEVAAQVVFLARKRDPVLAAAYLTSSIRQMEHELERKQKAPGLDDDDRKAFQTELGNLQHLYSEHAEDRAGTEAVAEVRRLAPGRPWYSIRSGPKNVHHLLAELELDGLSHFYRDLNPVVHGGMPLLALANTSGNPLDADSSEWLRPLRGPTPWSFRPLLATGLALKLALLEIVIGYFGLRAHESVSRLTQFAPEHNERCLRGEMPILSL